MDGFKTRLNRFISCTIFNNVMSGKFQTTFNTSTCIPKNFHIKYLKT